MSYADSGMHHHGYIYQATNWVYTGQTTERTDLYSEPGKHSRHYIEGETSRRVVRTSKHRYIYFCGDRRKVKAWRKLLKYEVKPYPKGTNENYIVGEQKGRLIKDTATGETYREAPKPVVTNEAHVIEGYLF